MGISMAQLAILAEKYNFDMNDARLTIGLPLSNRYNGKTADFPKKIGGKKVASSQEITWTVWPSPGIRASSHECIKSTKPTVEKQIQSNSKKKTGFNLYVMEAKERVRQDIVSGLKKGEKIGRGAVLAELGRRWQSLPQSARDLWNERAN